MNAVVAFALKHRVLMVVLFVMMLAGGIMAFRELNIETFGRTPVRRLSGGQRQRVALAAALLHSPDVAFLDEPSAGLDPHARLDVWRIVQEQADRGAAVVVTTHSFEEAERLARRIVIMHRGRVVADAPTDELVHGGSLERTYFALTGGDR